MRRPVLTNRRLPLRTTKRLTPPIRAQLGWILESEGAGSITAASKDPEWKDSLELVDVEDEAGATRYQLWLWPSGCAVLFEHETTNVVGSATQHGLAIASATLRKAMGVALADAEGLGLIERVRAVAPPKTVAPPSVSSAGMAGAIAAVRAMKDAKAARAAGAKLFEATFGPDWRPYPKRVPHELSADERLLIEAVIDDLPGVVSTELHHQGLVSREDHLARYLGRTTGPSDVIVRVGERDLPLWIAVTHVGSGDLAAEPVLAAFRRLPSDVALAAWTELARGEVCDIAIVHPRKMSEAGIPRTPGNVKHRARLFGWLADASLALGDVGRAAAERILADLPRWDWGHPAFVALASLARHARSRKQLIDPRHDATIARLHGSQVGVYCEPILAEIVKGLSKDRAAAASAKGSA